VCAPSPVDDKRNVGAFFARPRLGGRRPIAPRFRHAAICRRFVLGHVDASLLRAD
jgi:hypothetical protein